jgi:uncharacterized surface protein with fasciclin (FAS1) repeats
MKKSLKLLLTPVILSCMLWMTGCDDHQERFEDPPWLGGSSIETLEESGNYSIFLELMEKANYTEPIKKQLFTLFVPSNDAFAEYFTSAGINSVEEMTEDQAVQVFTLHVLRNPRSRYNLIYEYAWSEFQGPKGEYASLYHRKATPSTAIPYEETIRYTLGQEGQEVLIYTDNKYVPLFSAEYFNDYGSLDHGDDYTNMYPGSTWEEGYPEHLDGLNWHNAMVLPNPDNQDELEVRTSSGFIYFLDRVVPPSPTVEQYIKANQDKYGLYYDLLQRFAEYGGSKIDDQKRVLYTKSYDLIYDLASELASGGGGSSSCTRNMWTAFLPADDILQEYLDKEILPHYPVLDEVPRITMFYILQSQLAERLVLKSTLAAGYFNAFGDPIDYTSDDIISGYMCSNGVIYDSKKVIEPNVFTTVTKTLFFDENYSTLLYIMNQSGMLSSLANPEADVTVFVSTNEQLESHGVRYDALSDVVEFRGPIDGVWAPMKTIELVTFAQDQIYNGILSDLEGEGGFAEMSSANFIQYGNGQVAAGENQVKNTPVNIEDIVVNEKNGLLVKVDRPVASRVLMGQLLAGPLADTNLSEFAELLIDLRMLDDKFKDATTKENIPNLKFIAGGEYWTAFIPNNSAMAQARLDGLIPTEYPTSKTGQDSLKNFVNYHFIKEDVIFDDGKKSGVFNSVYSYTDTTDNTLAYEPLIIMNSANSLSVEDKTGQLITLRHADANNIVRKGVVHKIDAVLKYTE